MLTSSLLRGAHLIETNKHRVPAKSRITVYNQSAIYQPLHVFTVPCNLSHFFEGPVLNTLPCTCKNTGATKTTPYWHTFQISTLQKNPANIQIIATWSVFVLCQVNAGQSTSWSWVINVWRECEGAESIFPNCAGPSRAMYNAGQIKKGEKIRTFFLPLGKGGATKSD